MPRASLRDSGPKSVNDSERGGQRLQATYTGSVHNATVNESTSTEEDCYTYTNPGGDHYAHSFQLKTIRTGTSEPGDNDTGHIVREWTVSRGPNATLKITPRPSDGDSDLIDAIVTAFSLPEDEGDNHYPEQTVYGWMLDG